MHTRTVFRGDRAERYRKIAGLSRPDLSMLIGVSRNSIRRMELGEFQPRPAVVAAMAKALDRPVESFYSDDENEAAA